MHNSWWIMITWWKQQEFQWSKWCQWGQKSSRQWPSSCLISNNLRAIRCKTSVLSRAEFHLGTFYNGSRQQDPVSWEQEREIIKGNTSSYRGPMGLPLRRCIRKTGNPLLSTFMWCNCNDDCSTKIMGQNFQRFAKKYHSNENSIKED